MCLLVYRLQQMFVSLVRWWNAVAANSDKRVFGDKCGSCQCVAGWKLPKQNFVSGAARVISAHIIIWYSSCFSYHKIRKVSRPQCVSPPHIKKSFSYSSYVSKLAFLQCLQHAIYEIGIIHSPPTVAFSEQCMTDRSALAFLNLCTHHGSPLPP